jgi:hypothetical protein
MRVFQLTAGIILAAQCAILAQSQMPQAAQIPAGQLVREVVYNELNDHAAHGYWRYWIEKRAQNGVRLEEQVETPQGPVTRLAGTNGHPLDAAAQQQEAARLEHLAHSPSEQARHLEDYNEDEKRIGRILALLPDAFLYDYDGEENACYRLRFHPNPGYPAHSIEARIFHGMSGTLWIDSRMKRLARLDGRVSDNVDFGFGILGRLYKGGWFKLVRTQVSPTDWKTAQLEVHMSVRALLVKTFAKETSETRGGFEPVPAGMTLSQAMHLMESQDAASNPPPVSASLPLTPAVLALHQ